MSCTLSNPSACANRSAAPEASSGSSARNIGAVLSHMMTMNRIAVTAQVQVG